MHTFCTFNQNYECNDNYSVSNIDANQENENEVIQPKHGQIGDSRTESELTYTKNSNEDLRATLDHSHNSL